MGLHGSLDYTTDEILAAIKGSGGIMSSVAKKLDCTWHTAEKYTQLNDTTKQALAAESESILDMAEGQIYKSIKEGDIQSAKWVMATKGKLRGFSEKYEVQHSGEIQHTNVTIRGEDD